MKRKIATAVAALASLMPIPGTAIVAIPPIVVGPPGIVTNGQCRVAIAQPNGAGPGAAIPFRALALGAPVARTTTSFTTGGGGTSNAALAAERKARGLPYQPPTVNPESATLPAVFAENRGDPVMMWAPYQRLPLTASKRVAEPFGLIFAQATSPIRGRIAALTLSIAGRPAAPPRIRLTVVGQPDRGCQPMVVQVYAPATSAAALARLSTPAANGCRWSNMAACTRAQWPRGRVLFVSPSYGTTFEYRWIDYDLLADWRFARTR